MSRAIGSHAPQLSEQRSRDFELTFGGSNVRRAAQGKVDHTGWRRKVPKSAALGETCVGASESETLRVPLADCLCVYIFRFLRKESEEALMKSAQSERGYSEAVKRRLRKIREPDKRRSKKVSARRIAGAVIASAEANLRRPDSRELEQRQRRRRRNH